MPLTGTPDIGTLAKGATSPSSAIFVAAVEVAAPVLLAMHAHRRGLRARLARDAVAERLRGRLPGQGAVGLILLCRLAAVRRPWIGDQLQGSVASALGMLQAG